MKRLLGDFMQVTEAAALAVATWIGKGDKEAADSAATAAMRQKLNMMRMDAVVVIGEGELDKAPMLAIGERLGNGHGPELDIAVDPLEGTSVAVNGRENAMSVLAVAHKGSLLHAPDMYMQKIAVGPEATEAIDIDAPLVENIKAVAHALGKSIDQVTVTIQERDRHQQLVRETLNIGAKVRLFSDNDIVAGLSTTVIGHGYDSPNADLFVGTGGAPEGVILAAALKSFGGNMQGRLLPRDEGEYERCWAMGIDNPDKALMIDDMVRSDECLFVATGVTNGSLLNGVRTTQGNLVTHSLMGLGGEAPVTFFESVYRRNSFEV